MHPTPLIIHASAENAIKSRNQCSHFSRQFGCHRAPRSDQRKIAATKSPKRQRKTPFVSGHWSFVTWSSIIHPSAFLLHPLPHSHVSPLTDHRVFSLRRRVRRFWHRARAGTT